AASSASVGRKQTARRLRPPEEQHTLLGRRRTQPCARGSYSQSPGTSSALRVCSWRRSITLLTHTQSQGILHTHTACSSTVKCTHTHSLTHAPLTHTYTYAHTYTYTHTHTPPHITHTRFPHTL